MGDLSRSPWILVSFWMHPSVLTLKFAPRRPGDVTAIWADPTLANKELGWKAERSVEDTLEAAWAWEKRLAGK